MEAKQFLAAQGQLDASTIWGVLERLWASAFYIGATMIVSSNPWLCLILIPLHSGLNWFTVKLLQHSIIKSKLFIAAVALIKSDVYY